MDPVFEDTLIQAGATFALCLQEGIWMTPIDDIQHMKKGLLHELTSSEQEVRGLYRVEQNLMETIQDTEHR
eukprot:150285-Prorocentrum_lima.AAC.1